jgi:hypothetical protein
MLMGSGKMIAARKHCLNAVEDTVCIQTCKPALPRANPVARFMNRDAGQLRFYSAKALFAHEGRLTGFRRARKIVRIRTKCPAANDATFSTPLTQGIATIATFDSLTLA